MVVGSDEMIYKWNNEADESEKIGNDGEVEGVHGSSMNETKGKENLFKKESGKMID